MRRVTLLLRRLISGIFVVWGVLSAVFIISRIIPGNPVEIMMGERLMPAEVELMREKLGLTKPIYVQYAEYLGSVFTGDLGESIFYREPVLRIILRRARNTFYLAGVSLIMALIFSSAIALFAAFLKRGEFLSATTSSLFLSLPPFWLGPLLIILFSVKLGLFPVGGMGGLPSVVLPALTLAIPASAGMAAHLTAYLREARGSFFLIASIARGRSMPSAILTGALVYALMPFITVMGLEAGALLTGAVITEAVFAWPGLGRMIVLAIETRDYTLLQGGVIAISLIYVAVNLLTDILYSFVDPRVRAL